MDSSMVTATIGDAELSSVRAASPLAADLLLQCGPVFLPSAVAACTADAERQDGPSSDALRSALAADPWAGMGSLASDSWLLAAATSAVLVFAHRSGAVGIGQVLVLERHAEGWTPVALSGGARLAVPGSMDTGARVETVLAARPCRGGVELTWIGDGDLDGLPLRRLDDVRVAIDGDDVHVLLLTVPVEATGSRGKLSGGTGDQWVAGVGVTMRAVVELASPLGERTVLDDSRIPAVVVEVMPA